MTRTFASSPADVVTDALGNVLAGVKLTIKTDPGGVTITNLQTLGGTALPGYVTSNSQGRFPFQIPNDDYSRVQAVTPAGDIYRLPANEVFDQLGTAVSNAADAIAQASTANTNANQAKTQAAAAAGSVTTLTARVTTAEQEIDALQAAGPGGGTGSGAAFGPNRTWKNFTGGYCHHRTGGSAPTIVGGPSTATGVPGSIRAGEACLAMGCTFLDIDISTDVSGTAWVMHDRNQIELSTQLSGTIMSSQPQLLSGARLLASKTTGGRYQDEPMVTLREFLARFAGRAPILAEIKEQSNSTEYQAAVAAITPQVQGYLDCLLLVIAAQNVAAFSGALQAAGLPWAFYHNSSNVNDATIRSTAISNGAKQVMLTTAATLATVNAYKQAGVQVIGFGNGRRSTNTIYTNLGVPGIMDEFASHVGMLGGTVKTDSWRHGFWGSGDVPADGQSRPILQPDGTGLLFSLPNGSNRQWMLASEFYPLPAAFTLDLHLQLVGATTTGNWFGVNVCNQSDASFTDNAGADPTGYTCYMFPGAGSPASGLQIATREGSATTTRATASMSAVVPAGGEFWLRVVVDANNVTLSRRDSAGTQIGTSAVYADAQWRGGYIHIGAVQNSTVQVKVRDLTIT